MPDSEELIRRAHRSEMLGALLRHSTHELRNVAQLLGITKDALQHNPAIDAVYREAITHANDSLLVLLERLERTLIPPGTRASPFAAADPVDSAAALATRKGPASHLDIEVDVPRSLRPCAGVEAEMAEALYALLQSLGEMTRGLNRVKVRITATERPDHLELVVVSDAQASGARLQEQWSMGVSRARTLLRQWAGGLEATTTLDGRLAATFRMPWWERQSLNDGSPVMSGL
jgi:hypothetical protein